MAVLGLLLSAEPEVESCHAKDLFIWFPWCIANTILSGFIARGGATARGTCLALSARASCDTNFHTVGYQQPARYVPCLYKYGHVAATAASFNFSLGSQSPGNIHAHWIDQQACMTLMKKCIGLLLVKNLWKKQPRTPELP